MISLITPTYLYDDVVNKKLSDLLRGIKDDEMDKIQLIIIFYREIWNYIDNDVQQKIAQYIQNLPSRDISSLNTFLDFKPLRTQAKERLRNINQIDKLSQLCGFDLHPLVADRSIDLYLTSNSYDAANKCSKFIIENYTDYSVEQIERIIKGIVTNEQIKKSFEVGSVIYKLKQNKKLDPDTFDKLLEENDLYQYISSKDNEDDF